MEKGSCIQLFKTKQGQLLFLVVTWVTLSEGSLISIPAGQGLAAMLLEVSGKLTVTLGSKLMQPDWICLVCM